jgi:oligogalacturonide transporter
MKKTNPLVRKIAFASADLFGGGSFNIINFLYPGFLALVVGISPFWSSFIMLVARVFDAIIDPIIGWISDRTESRFGKRRIYLIVVSPLIIVGMFLVFYPYQFPNEMTRVIAVLISYLTFVAIQSSIMIPYISLSSEISTDYQQRASFNSYRLGFSIFSSIVCVAVPGIIVNSYEDPLIGYQVMSLSFGVFFAISVLLSGLFAREEIKSPVLKEKLSFKALFIPLKIKAFRQYLLMFLTTQMTMAILSGLFFFYIDFFIVKDLTAEGQSTAVGLIGAALMFSMQIVALPIYLKLIASKGKTFVFRIGSLLWIVAGLTVILIPANVNPLIVYLLAAVMGFGISAPGLIPHTMFGDVVDAGELKLGKRLEGNMSGFTNFMNQIAQAIGLSATMFILGLAGFKEQDLTMPPLNSQPDSALLAIRLTMALAPLLLMGIGIWISYQYKITAKRQNEILIAIQSKTKDINHFSDIL